MVSVSEVIEHLGFGSFSARLYVVLGLWWMVDGLELTLMSLLTPYLRCDLNITTNQAALVSSLVFFGTGVGTFYWGCMADIFGRKRTFVVCVAMAFYFALLSAFTTTYVWLLAIRGFVGVAIGGICLSPIYIVEYYSKDYRARLSIMVDMFFVGGNLFAMLVGYFTLKNYGYQWFLLLSAIPLPITLLMTYYLPESLLYLQNVGDIDGIMKILTGISKEHGVSLPKEIEFEERAKMQGEVRILFNKEYRRTTLCLICTWVSALCVYYCNVLLNVELFTVDYCGYQVTAKKEPSSCERLTGGEYVSSLLVVLSEVAGLCVYYFLLVDRVGRRPCIISGLAINLCGFFLINFCLPMNLRTLVMVFMRASTSATNQVLFLYTLELYPTTIRATGLGFCNTFARWSLVAVPFIVQSLVHYSVPLTMAIFVFLCVLGIASVYVIGTETKGMHLKSK